MTALQEITAKAMLERELHANVVQVAKLLGWSHYFTYDARRSPEGFPDLVLVRGDQMLCRELKRETKRPTPPQLRWLALLDDVRRISTGVWKPSDWLTGRIERELRGLAR